MHEKVAHPNTTGWDERALLLLGVLMDQDRHGYQVNEFIERALCRVTSMKKPTAYALLDRLAGGGYVGVTREQAGNRPPRKVYSITPDGRSLFAALLRESLSEASRVIQEGDIGLMLLNYLEPDVAIQSLKMRLQQVDILLAQQSHVPEHGAPLSIDLALDHLRAIRCADRDWLISVIEQLERENRITKITRSE